MTNAGNGVRLSFLILPEAKVQRSLFDVPVLLEGFFEPSDRYRLFREKILPALEAKRSELCALYCEDNGRPAVEPVLALGVSLLQFMEKVPDRKAVENVKLHLGWKYALDLELDEEGFDHTTLVNFRQRLVEGEAVRIGFDAIVDALREAGLVRKGGRQRLDSTHVFGCVAKMSRLECVCDTCQLQTQCTKRKDGRRHLTVGLHHDLLQERRRGEMHTEDFKLKMQRRNAIEGSISEFTRQGARRTRYRGLAKTTLANYLQGAAVNGNRWVRLVQWQCQEQKKAA